MSDIWIYWKLWVLCLQAVFVYLLTMLPWYKPMIHENTWIGKAHGGQVNPYSPICMQNAESLLQDDWNAQHNTYLVHPCTKASWLLICTVGLSLSFASGGMKHVRHTSVGVYWCPNFAGSICFHCDWERGGFKHPDPLLVSEIWGWHKNTQTIFHRADISQTCFMGSGYHFSLDA